MTSLVLASGSVARRQLLENAGYRFDVVKADVDERALERASPDLAPLDLALHLATAKALDVSQKWPDAIVIGADQLLVLDGECFHKSSTLADAHSALARLSGRTHRLLSAAVLIRGGTVLARVDDHADLTMRSLKSDDITAYLNRVGESVLGSVGCYHLEGYGVHLFDRIDGDHFTIMGLPLLPVLAHLRDLGVSA